MTSHARDSAATDTQTAATSDLAPSETPDSSLWRLDHRRELQQLDESVSSGAKKRGSSRVSPHLSTIGGPPPNKKIHRRDHPRQDPQSSHRRPFSEEDPIPGSLFFSHQTQQRPALPYRLSSSEVGANMLSKASKEESGGVKTLKLARGSTSVGSPARPVGPRTPSGSGRSHLGISGKARSSPDGSSKRSGIQVLNQVGIVELLEQDERPTFILDLSDHASFEPGALKFIFANASLKASKGLLGTISGAVVHASPAFAATTGFSEFKAWCVSYTKDYEAMDVALPSYTCAGFVWTCCSLRRRFRVFKAVPTTPKPVLNSSTPSMSLPSGSPLGKENDLLGSVHSPRPERLDREAQDYFGYAPTSPMSFQYADQVETETKKLSGRRLDSGPKIGMVASHQPHASNTSSASATSVLTPMKSRGDESISGAVDTGCVDQTNDDSHVEQPYFDWTRMTPSPSLPRHIQFARSIDWASTSLGAIEGWSSDLRSMCNLIMASPYPAAMYWGKDLIAIYNEAYILIAGSKHPQLMGQSYRMAWGEIWESVKDVFEAATTTGQATMKDDDCLFIHRSADNKVLEETYFSWSIIPLVGNDGNVVGLYNPAFEKTRRKVAERRMLTLRELGEKTATARDLKTFWEEVLNGLNYNEMDAPFVLLYSVTENNASDSQSSIHLDHLERQRQCILEGSLGVPEDHPAAAKQIDLRNGNTYFAHVFREAIKDDRPKVLSVEDGTLDGKMLEGIEWRGFGDPCTAAVCCPIRLTGSESTLGFLFMGINPRRPYDDDYSLFVQLLSRQLATAMASVVLFENEIARGQRAARIAALDRIELSEQLAARTQEAVESETKFTRMAEFAPVGIFIADSRGKITYCNEKWYAISKVSKGSESTEQWMAAVVDEDRERLLRQWHELVHNAIALSMEIRFKSSWVDKNGKKGDTWVIASAYPEKDDFGNVKVIFGSITDISQQKWAEHFEKRRMEEAVETKRQQENFIDITSHEMRNPLSAILQCADEISTSLSDHTISQYSRATIEKLTQNAVEAAGTIALCAQHQKRIVDDILTLSKLDSALLLVTPYDIKPRTVVQQALKMFEGEVQQHDIKLHFRLDESIDRLGIEWIRLDPSRLLQVLINLTTNAIKFTSTQAKRIINVTLGASIERPSRDGAVSYFASKSKGEDLTESPDWGKGEKVFVHFSVEDTGRGLSDEEKQVLFIRFSQASPRTHVQYGGSGLGLFISRQLVELQGGEIGVASTAGKGSTFAFYVKARRSSAPTNETDEFPSVGARKQSAGKGVAPTTSMKSLHMSDAATAERKMPKSSLKILIVEDNLVNQKVLSRQLKNLGCVVHVANHGEECLDRLRESTFWKGNGKSETEISVILMDQEMPVMDGLTCTKEIRALERKGDVTGHVPIIAVTANARSEQIDTAMGSGMVSGHCKYATG